MAKAGSCYEATIEVPAQLAPLSLAFQLQAGGARKEELGSAGRNFAVPIGMSPGRVAPMGEGSCKQAQCGQGPCHRLVYGAFAPCDKPLVVSAKMMMVVAFLGTGQPLPCRHGACTRDSSKHVRLSAGASLLSTSGASSAVNFVVRSRGASAVALILARKPLPDAAAAGKKPGGCLEIALDPVINRTGDLWHIAVQVYAQWCCLSGPCHSERALVCMCAVL